MSDTWLIVIDPQVIFASPTSSWGSPAFPDIIEPINRMVAAFRGRTIVTRWIPATTHSGSWRDYFDRWTFADRPADDPIFDLVDEAQTWAQRPTIDVTTFGTMGNSTVSSNWRASTPRTHRGLDRLLRHYDSFGRCRRRGLGESCV